MDAYDIIRMSLEEYDRNSELIDILLENAAIRWYRPYNDKKIVIEFMGKHDTESFTCEVEFLSIYYDKYKFWCWAWGVPSFNEIEMGLAKGLVNYAIDAHVSLYKLKTLLTMSKSIMNNKYQTDINVALASHIIKKRYILPITLGKPPNEFTAYMILLDEDLIDKHIARYKSRQNNP